MKLLRKSKQAEQDILDKVTHLLFDKYHDILEQEKDCFLPIEIMIERIVGYYENVISTMPGNVYWLDSNCITMGCSKNVLDMFGFKSLKEFKGLTFEEMGRIGRWPPEATLSFKNDTMSVIKTGKAKTNIEEPPIPHADGKIIHFLTNRVPLFDHKNSVIGVVGISIDITDRKKMEKELKEAKETAEAANARIKAMAGSIAHELRTPLEAVGMNIGAVDSALNDPTEENLVFAHEILGTMRKEVESANTVINMLLMNIREDVNWQKEKMEPCSMNQCMEEALNRYPFLEGQKEKVTWKKSEDFTFQGNAIFMQHVIFNLLKNALYQIASEGKGIIEIWTEQNGDAFELHFKDTAKGIPADILPHIFEKFFSNTKKGTGLGLAFCKMVVEAFGGTISCKSEEGKRTEFIIRL